MSRDHIFLLVLLISTISKLNAQAPQGISYQAVAKDASGGLVSNQNISIRLSILTQGNAIYVETHGLLINDQGLFNLVIGRGSSIQGSFSNIDWSSGDKFLKSEIDINGGDNFVEVGTTEFLSVPYSFYANKSGNTPVQDYYFPDGLDGERIIINLGDTYVVPNDKTLYINCVLCRIDGASSGNNFYDIVASGSTITLDSTRLVSEMGLLVNQKVKVVRINFYNIDKYVVPNGKNLHLVFSALDITLNGVPIAINDYRDNPPTFYLFNLFIFSPGSILGIIDIEESRMRGCDFSTSSITVSGYLVDQE